MDTIVINDLFSAIFNVLYFAVILATIFILFWIIVILLKQWRGF